MGSSVVETCSHLSVWVIGLVAFIYFLEEFEAELKPLVLAFIFVSLLEAVVQQFEWVFQKAWCLAKLLLWKSWQILGIACVAVCGCPVDEEERKQLRLDVLYNWSDLTRPWDGRAAGSHTFFRIVSVVLTLLLVVLICVVTKQLLEQQISTVIGKFDLYKHQLVSMASYVNDQIPHLERLAPETFRNETRKMINKFKDNVNDAAQEVPQMAENFGLSILNDVLATSSARLLDLAFFLLYSAFMLFDPLHINFDEADEEDWRVAGSSGSPSRKTLASGWLRRTLIDLFQVVCAEVQASWRRRRGRPAARDRADCGAEGMQQRAEPLLRDGQAAVRDEATTTGGERSEAQPEVGDLEALAPAPSGLSSQATRDPPARLEDVVGEVADTAQRPTTTSAGDRLKLLELQQDIYKIVWQWFLLTVVLNVVFASLIFVLLVYVNVDLSVLLAMWCFVLGFIPELGAFISVLLPIPFILLTPTDECRVPEDHRLGGGEYYQGEDIDCIMDFQARLQNVMLTAAGMLGIKFLVSNVLSPVLMGRSRTLAGAVRDDQEVGQTHGVIVLFAVVFFGKVWGTVGMLISVPVISVVRRTLNVAAERDKEHKKEQMQESIRARTTSWQRFPSVVAGLGGFGYHDRGMTRTATTSTQGGSRGGL